MPSDAERLMAIETDVKWIRQQLEEKDCKTCEAFKSVDGNKVYRKLTWANFLGILSMALWLIKKHIIG